jgi:hypothetical protein
MVEKDLCDRFSTHRGDGRLVLFELKKKGLVERIPNRGSIVHDLTPKEVTAIYAVREELELMPCGFSPSRSQRPTSSSSMLDTCTSTALTSLPTTPTPTPARRKTWNQHRRNSQSRGHRRRLRDRRCRLCDEVERFVVGSDWSPIRIFPG